MICATALSSCSPFDSKKLIPLPNQFPSFENHPSAAVFEFPDPVNLPTYNPDSSEMWQVNYRSVNASKLDLSTSLEALLFSSYDAKTIWPSAEKMPAGFDPQLIMEIGKNPGLGVQQLHKKGITGSGVGIAIIDQRLLVDHVEYAGQLQVYEEDSSLDDSFESATMHGAAVASIAVGKTMGVAPDADLYYIASTICSQGTYETNDFSCQAKNVRRILEINDLLPDGRKIRVISMSVGWNTQSKGYADIEKAVKEAKEQGLFVISTSMDQYYGFNYMGLGRQPMADPDEFLSYEPGIFWARYGDKILKTGNILFIPMDSRTTASPTGVEDYVFYRDGGLSWSVPYIAGVYALAAQVKPDITPDEFWAAALKTGQMIEIKHDGNLIPFGPIIDPQALIKFLQVKE